MYKLVYGILKLWYSSINIWSVKYIFRGVFGVFICFGMGD